MSISPGHVTNDKQRNDPLSLPTSPRIHLSDNVSFPPSSYVSRALPTSLTHIPTSLTNSSIPSETSSEGTDYRGQDKIENLQILVRQLSRQLQSEKIRKEGIDTLSRCLSEERSETSQLKQKQTQQEEIIKILQTRLINNGLPISVELEAGEQLGASIVGQETFDSLIRENLSLKSELKYLSVDPAKMDDALKQNITLREQFCVIQQQLQLLQTENQELHQVLSARDDEKIQEIYKLRTELQDIIQKGQTKDVLCQSLSEQSRTLQERLRETGQLCQELLQRLEQVEGASLNPQSTLGSSFVKLNLTGEAPLSNQSNSPADPLQDEIRTLRTKLQQVVDVNQKWQEYHDKREEEFKTLQERLKNTEHRLAQAPTASRLSEQQQEQIDKLILQYKRQMETIEDDKLKILDENRELRVHLDQQTTTNQRLEQQIRGLLEQLRTATKGGRPTSNEDKERIAALELQIKVCTEDFNCERRDRERAHHRLNELEREVEIYKTQLESLQAGARAQIHQRRFGRRTHVPVVQCDNINLADVPMPEAADAPPQLIGRGLYQADSEPLEGEDEVDLPAPRPSRTHATMNGELASRTPSTGTLHCPQCRAKFTKDRHTDLLEHMEDCLK